MSPLISSPWTATRRASVEETLDRLLPRPERGSATVAEAMRYATLGGGKRLRALLVIASCEACEGPTDLALSPASAVEMLHAYSLVHDDLPAMDDADLRRGKPSLHRVFGEAVAVLAGDALLTLAFEVLASEPASIPGQRRAEAVGVVARAAGLAGMVGGQIADLEAEGRRIDLEEIEWIHRHKTGALIAASAELGAVLAGAPEGPRAALARYGIALGLAFQVADDILDVTATEAEIGKRPGTDDRAGKATFASLLGPERARAEAQRWAATATAELEAAGVRSPVLEELARFSIERSG